MESTSMRRWSPIKGRRLPTKKGVGQKGRRKATPKIAKTKLAKPILTKPKLKVAAESKEVDLRAMLNLRKKIAEKRPRFIRQESWRYNRIKKAWKKPKGIDSKMRLSVKGWPAAVNVGYRGPSIVRELHPSGLRDVLIHNIQELRRLDPKKDAARLISTLGARKRELIFSEAKNLGIRILNPRGLRLVRSKI